MSGSARPAKSTHEVVLMQASAAQVATNTGVAAVRLPVADAYGFILDITADESTTADKLDVYIQTRFDDGGENWLDVVHFTQNNGDDGATQYVSKIVKAIAVTEYEVGTALAETTVRHLMGDEWRVRWTVLDDSGSASYTFSVSAMPM